MSTPSPLGIQLFSPQRGPPSPFENHKVPPLILPLPFCGHSPQSTRGEGGGGPYPFQKSPLPPPPLNLLRKPAASRPGQASWPVACLTAGRGTPGRPPSWQPGRRIDFQWISSIFIGFHRCSLDFIVFHRISLLFIGYHRFLLDVLHVHWISWICTGNS